MSLKLSGVVLPAAVHVAVFCVLADEGTHGAAEGAGHEVRFPLHDVGKVDHIEEVLLAAVFEVADNEVGNFLFAAEEVARVIADRLKLHAFGNDDGVAAVKYRFARFEIDRAGKQGLIFGHALAFVVDGRADVSAWQRHNDVLDVGVTGRRGFPVGIHDIDLGIDHSSHRAVLELNVHVGQADLGVLRTIVEVQFGIGFLAGVVEDLLGDDALRFDSAFVYDFVGEVIVHDKDVLALIGILGVLGEDALVADALTEFLVILQSLVSFGRHLFLPGFLAQAGIEDTVGHSHSLLVEDLRSVEDGILGQGEIRKLHIRHVEFAVALRSAGGGHFHREAALIKAC